MATKYKTWDEYKKARQSGETGSVASQQSSGTQANIGSDGLTGWERYKLQKEQQRYEQQKQEESGYHPNRLGHEYLANLQKQHELQQFEAQDQSDPFAYNPQEQQSNAFNTQNAFKPGKKVYSLEDWQADPFKTEWNMPKEPSREVTKGGGRFANSEFEKFKKMGEAAGTSYEDNPAQYAKEHKGEIQFDERFNGNKGMSVLSRMIDNDWLRQKFPDLYQYTYMTQDELDRYNYTLARYGKEQAYQYFKSLQDDIEQRKANETAKAVKDSPAPVKPFLYGLTAAQGGLNQTARGVKNAWRVGADAVGDAVGSIKDKGSAAERFAQGPEIAQPNEAELANAKIAQQLGRQSGWNIPFIGKGWKQFLYEAGTTTAAQLPQIGASLATGGVGAGAVLGASAFGNRYAEAREQGFSHGESVALGAESAAIEAITEKIGGVRALSGGTLTDELVDSWVGSWDNAIARVLARGGLSAIGEGAEEGLGDIMSWAAEKYIHHIDEDLDWSEVFYDSLLGATSGVLLGSGEAVSTTARENVDRAVSKEYARKTLPIMQNANVSNEQKQSYLENALRGAGAEEKDVSELAQNLIKRTNGEDLSKAAQKKMNANKFFKPFLEVLTGESADANAQSDTVVQAAGIIRDTVTSDVATDEQKKAATVEALKTVLPENEQSNIDTMAGSIVKLVQGKQLETWEQAELARSSEALQLASNILEGNTNTQTAESVQTEQTTETVQPDRRQDTARNDEIGQAANAVAYTVTSEDTTVQQKHAATLEALDAVGINGEQANAMASGIVKIANNEQINTEEQQALASDARAISLAQEIARAGKAESETAEAVPEEIQAYAKNWGDNAVKYASIYQQGEKINPQEFDMAFERAYNRGYNDIALGSNTGKLNSQQAQAAWQLGREAGANATQEQTEKLGERGVSTETGADTSAIQGAIFDSLNAEQKNAIDVSDTIAKALGIKVVWYASETNEEGRRTSENGYFDPSDSSVHLDIYAGSNARIATQYAAMRTFSHELVHYIENWSPMQYAILRKQVFEHLRAAGKDIDALIDAKLANGPEGMTRIAATQEVVADGCEMMLRDSDAIRMAAAQNKTLWQKIKEQFSKFVENLRKAFEGIEAEHEEAKALRKEFNGVIKYMVGLQETFDNALADASKNTQARREALYQQTAETGSNALANAEVQTAIEPTDNAEVQMRPAAEVRESVEELRERARTAGRNEGKVEHIAEKSVEKVEEVQQTTTPQAAPAEKTQATGQPTALMETQEPARAEQTMQEAASAFEQEQPVVQQAQTAKTSEKATSSAVASENSAEQQEQKRAQISRIEERTEETIQDKSVKPFALEMPEIMDELFPVAANAVYHDLEEAKSGEHINGKSLIAKLTAKAWTRDKLDTVLTAYMNNDTDWIRKHASDAKRIELVLHDAMLNGYVMLDGTKSDGLGEYYANELKRIEGESEKLSSWADDKAEREEQERQAEEKDERIAKLVKRRDQVLHWPTSRDKSSIEDDSVLPFAMEIDGFEDARYIMGEYSQLAQLMEYDIENEKETGVWVDPFADKRNEYGNLIFPEYSTVERAALDMGSEQQLIDAIRAYANEDMGWISKNRKEAKKFERILHNVLMAEDKIDLNAYKRRTQPLKKTWGNRKEELERIDGFSDYKDRIDKMYFEVNASRPGAPIHWPAPSQSDTDMGEDEYKEYRIYENDIQPFALEAPETIDLLSAPANMLYEELNDKILTSEEGETADNALDKRTERYERLADDTTLKELLNEFSDIDECQHLTEGLLEYASKNVNWMQAHPVFAKRIEGFLDKTLRDGYTLADKSETLEPSEKYMNLLTSIQEKHQQLEGEAVEIADIQSPEQIEAAKPKQKRKRAQKQEVIVRPFDTWKLEDARDNSIAPLVLERNDAWDVFQAVGKKLQTEFKEVQNGKEPAKVTKDTAGASIWRFLRSGMSNAKMSAVFDAYAKQDTEWIKKHPQISKWFEIQVRDEIKKEWDYIDINGKSVEDIYWAFDKLEGKLQRAEKAQKAKWRKRAAQERRENEDVMTWPERIEKRDYFEDNDQLAFCLEVPEVMQFYKPMAAHIISEVENTVKGERLFLDRYDTGPTIHRRRDGSEIQNFGSQNVEVIGVPRQTYEEIKILKDRYGYTYDEITEMAEKFRDYDRDWIKKSRSKGKKFECLLHGMLNSGYGYGDFMQSDAELIESDGTYRHWLAYQGDYEYEPNYDGLEGKLEEKKEQRRKHEEYLAQQERMESGLEEREKLPFQARMIDNVSDRELLANALESAAKTDGERKILRNYKQKARILDEKQAQAEQLQARLMDANIGKADMVALQQQYNQILKEVSNADAALLELEATSPIRSMMDRERAAYTRKSREQRDAAIANYRERRKDTLVRQGVRSMIEKRVKQLDRMLREPNTAGFVPEQFKQVTIEFLKPFAQDTSVFSASKLAEVQAAYRSMFEGESEDVNTTGFDEETYEKLDELRQKLEGRRLSQLNAEELRKVKEIMDNFTHVIQSWDQTFINGRRQSVSEAAEAIKAEAAKNGERKKYGNVIEGAREFMLEGNVTPVYFFKRIGGKLNSMFKDFTDGETKWALTMRQSREFFENTGKKYHYSEWSDKPGDILKFKTSSGKEARLTREEALGLWATRERELHNTFQQASHLETGGYVLDKPTKHRTKMGIQYTYEGQEAIRLTEADMEQIRNWLTAEQKGYATEMVRYLSEDMAALGNEVSMKLVGYKKFGEKFYYPYKSAGDYLATDLGKTEGALLKNMGFTKKTTRYAGNPIIAKGFTEVWSEHVNNMAMYNALAVAQDSFMRVYNHTVKSTKYNGYESVKRSIKSAYGDAAARYIETFMNDVYGGVRNGYGDRVGQSLLNKFKKGATFASASVVIQQPSAIARAALMVNPKYLFFPFRQGGKAARAEMMQYSGTAIIKQMGRFDMNSGRSAAEWLRAKDMGDAKIGEKVRELFSISDSSYRDDLFGSLAEKADEVTWARIWRAVKAEVKHKNKSLTGEALLRETGKRFDDVVRFTQVYDSVMVRSQFMRDKGMFAKMATAFMAEPTLSLNMLMDSVANKNNGNRAKNVMRAASVFVASVTLNSALKAIVQAARDDDDDKTYAEKYAAKFVGNIIGQPLNTKDGWVSALAGVLGSELSPVQLIPIARDAVNLFQGYDVSRTDMDLVSDLVKAVQTAVDPDAEPVDKAHSVIGSTAAFLGLPVNNIWRDVEAFVNTVSGVRKQIEGGPEAQTSEEGLKYAIMTELGYNDKKIANVDRMMDSLISGDMDNYNALRAHMVSAQGLGMAEEDVNSAMKSAIKTAYTDGTLEESRAIEFLKKYAGVTDANEAERQVRKWETEQLTGSTSEYSRALGYISEWDGAAFKKEIRELTALGIEGKNIRSAMTNEFKPIYLAARGNNKATLKSHLIVAYSQVYQTEGKTAKEAEEAAKKLIAGWEKKK